jgi:prepilin-type N-terminal cleavage/methylation domain-containing protein
MERCIQPIDVAEFEIENRPGHGFVSRDFPGFLRARRGFTLAESLIASVVLAVAVVGVSGAMMASYQQSDVSESDAIAVSLGKSLMEEIASRPLSLPDATAGWPTVTDRTAYDTINDFNGYTDRVTASVSRTSTLSAGTFSGALPSVTAVTDGSTSLSPAQYLRSVAVTYPTSLFGKSVSGGDFAAGDFALVKVTVTGSDGASLTLSRLISNVTVSR